MAVDKNFVVKNGLEVNSDLIVTDSSDSQNKKVGIGSTGPRTTLDVRGGIAATDGNFTGILTAASVDIADFGDLNGTGANITGFSTLGGVSADQLSVSGVGTFTDISYDEATGRNLNLTGIATIPVFVGLTSFNDGVTVSGVSTISTLNVSGVATIATVDINAGDIEVTNVDTTDLNVTGVGTIANARVTNLDVTGIGTVATANITTLSNYPNFTGGATVVGTVTAAHFSGGGLGVGVRTTGSVIGYGFTMLNFVGSGNTFAVNGTTVDISIAGGGGGGGGSASIGVGSTPGDAFSGIITAGNLWYNTGLGRLFIYYQDDNSAQWVDAAPFNVGIITTLTNVSFDAGTVAAPAISFGSDTDSGFFSPTDGSVTVSSNGVGVVTFNASGVNVNGVVTATSFSGDGSGLTGVASTDNIQTATAAKFLSDVSISGVTTVGVVTGGTSVSATHFYGDGSALTGIDATAIKDSGGNVKAQANPNGIEITGILTGSTANFTGVTTISNVIVGGATTELIVEGDARITGILTIGTSSITLDGANNTVNVGTGVTLDAAAGTVKATTFIGDGSQLTGAGVGTETNVNTSGIITATRFVGSGTSLRFAPKIIAFNPLALQQNVAAGSSIHITFDQNIHFVGSGDVVIREGSPSGTAIQTFSISSGSGPSGLSIVDTQLIIEPSSNFNLGTSIYVTLPSTGIANTEGDFFAGSTNYNFGTVIETFSAQGGDVVFTEVAPTSPTGYHRFHIFTSSGILTTTSDVSNANDFAMVLVAGGGAGGQGVNTPSAYSYGAGGGGAGGIIRHTGPTVILAAGDHTVTIGSGGDNTGVTPGNNSTLVHPTNTYTATGGGGGGNHNGPADQYLPNHQFQGDNGGSGGGAAGNFAPELLNSPPTEMTATPAGTGIAGQGNPGGGSLLNHPSGYTSPPSTGVPSQGGGGGGAGGTGGDATNPPLSGFPSAPPFPANGPTAYQSFQAGDGGNGLANPEFPEPILAPHLPSPYSALAVAMGPTGLLGGGGGGGNGGSTPTQWSPDTPIPNRSSIPGAGRGGPGGGGDGTGLKVAPFPTTIVYSSVPYRSEGVVGTGGGGGGGAWGSPGFITAKQGGNGGSGIFMVRYATPSP